MCAVVASDTRASQRLPPLPARRPQTGRGAAARCSRRRLHGPDRQRRARLRAGQSRDLAGGSRRAFPALLPPQSKPCPLLAASAPGDFRLPTLAEDLDIRTDLRVTACFRRGELVEEPVTSAPIGATILSPSCWAARFHSRKRGRWRHRAAPHHLQRHRADVSYLDRHLRRPAVPRPMVVSMRPMKPADAIRAIQITTRFPAVHGRRCISASPSSSASPIWQSPTTEDLGSVNDDEIPVFWACGVTAIGSGDREAEFCITHYPGSMLVTDRRNTEFAIRWAVVGPATASPFRSASGRPHHPPSRPGLAADSARAPGGRDRARRAPAKRHSRPSRS